MANTISRKLGQAIKGYLFKNGLYMGEAAPYPSLVSLLASLKPLETNRELIRVGGDGDGGYLIPNDLEGVDACFSPGVDTTSDFESDLAVRGIKCFLADFSVDAPPVDNPLFDFEKKYLGVDDDETFITLESWIDRKAPGKGDLLLQMDIEGSEYPVILDSKDCTLLRFRIIVIEFHGLEAMFSKSGCDLIGFTFAKLLKSFDVVHIHPNNCCGVVSYGDLVIPRVMEFTFLRKDRVASRAPAKKFPNLLDRKNVVSRPDIHLPGCWY